MPAKTQPRTASLPDLLGPQAKSTAILVSPDLSAARTESATSADTDLDSTRFGDVPRFHSIGSLEDAEPSSYDSLIWCLVKIPSNAEIGRMMQVMRQLSAPHRVVLVYPAQIQQRLVLTTAPAGLAIRQRRQLQSGNTGALCIATDFLVRPLEEGDIGDVLELFHPSFHNQRSREHWHWKFEQNPLAQRLITIARHRQGKLAAHYAGYPVILKDALNDRRYTALQIGDTMTAPEFRAVGRGPTSLLARTVAHFYANYCTDQVAFNYGFNTGNIQRFSFRYVGARMVEPAPYWERPSSPTDFAPRAIAASRRYQVRRLEQVSPAFDRLFHRVQGEYGVLIERSAQWLRWRYLDCPDQPRFQLYGAYRWGRLVGWSVFRWKEDGLVWCDALMEPRHRDCAASLIGKALTDGPKQADNRSPIKAWFSERPSWWAEHLRALNFQRCEEPNDLAMVCVPHQEPEAVSLLQRAYYSWGDSDLA